MSNYTGDPFTPQDPYQNNNPTPQMPQVSQWPPQDSSPQSQPQQPMYSTPQYAAPQYNPQATPVAQQNIQQSQQGYYPQQEPSWNGLAIAGFVCSFFFSVIGLVLSIIGFTQINKTAKETGVEPKGKGLALAGIIISGVALAFQVLLIMGGFGAMFSMGNSGYTAGDFQTIASAVLPMV